MCRAYLQQLDTRSWLSTEMQLLNRPHRAAAAVELQNGWAAALAAPHRLRGPRGVAGGHFANVRLPQDASVAVICPTSCAKPRPSLLGKR